MKILPPKARLDELLHFDPDTGEIRWKVDRRGRAKAGDIAGTIKTNSINGKQYRQICIDQRRYLAHRLAHYYYTGEQPNEVDHKNGNGLDNRRDNLRSADDELNSKNRGMRNDNTSGVIGVNYMNRMKLWRAIYGSVERRKQHGTQKYFETFAEAVAQRRIWEDQFGMTEAKKHREGSN